MSFGETPQPKKLPIEDEELELKKKPQEVEISEEEQHKILDSVARKTSLDPMTELTQQEASVMYQVDKDLLTAKLLGRADALKKSRGFSEDMSDEEIQRLPDYEQVKSLIIERLQSEKNVINTTNALKEIMEAFGVEGFTPATYINALKEKMNDWQQRGVFDYLAIELIKDNNRHNIVPVPNAEFDAEQITNLAKKFGEDQPHPTHVQDEAGPWGPDENDADKKMYTQYSPAELSGEVIGTDMPIRLTLFPISYESKALGYNTVEKQQSLLAELQQPNQELNLRAPSQLEAISHWYVLRLIGELREDSYLKTVVRSFDLKPKQSGDKTYVPRSYVDTEGQPTLSRYDADRNNYERLALS